MSLGLGDYKLSYNDFECLSEQFKLKFSELQKEEVKEWKTNKRQNFLIWGLKNREWLDWLSKCNNRATRFANFKKLIKSLLKFHFRASSNIFANWSELNYPSGRQTFFENTQKIPFPRVQTQRLYNELNEIELPSWRPNVDGFGSYLLCIEASEQ